MAAARPNHPRNERLQVGERKSLAMSILALGIYTSCLALNWGWQVSYLTHLYHTAHSAAIYVYVALMSFVVYDDVVLTQWLVANCRAKIAALRACGKVDGKVD